MNKHNTEYLGLDLGDRYSQLCILDQAGQVVAEERLETTPAGLAEFFADRPPQPVALEVGTHSRWVAAQLAEYGHTVVVAHPRQLRLIYQNPRKSDRADAEYLARLVRADPQLLSPVTHRPAGQQAHLALVRSRDGLVAARTQLVNHARGLAKSFGVRLPSSSTAAFAKKARAAVPAELAPALDPVLTTIQDLSTRIRAYDQEMRTLCLASYPETAPLRQIPGVGPLTALTFILTIADPTRFTHSRDVPAYLGLVPGRNQSGDHDPGNGITKTGDPYLRRLLVSSAHYILGPFGPDCALRRWGLQLAERGGRGAKLRAVVAVARKLAVLLHKLWLTQADYQPFYPHTTAPPQEDLTATN